MSYYHDDDGSDDVEFTDALVFVVVVGLAGIVGLCVLLQWLFPV